MRKAQMRANLDAIVAYVKRTGMVDNCILSSKVLAVLQRIGTYDYYVYAHCDHTGPRYVGLGHGDRIANSRRQLAKNRGVRPDKFTSVILHRGLTRHVARQIEVGWIAEWGRISEGGVLFNISPREASF
jgi:hypothetical protein